MNSFVLNNGISMPQVAIESGYQMIDTAEAYGNEQAVGDGIRESGMDRRKLFLVTKVNFKSCEHTCETVMNSLRLLGTDYLDLVLLHWPFANYYAAWRELESLYKEGIIRAIGVSNFEPDRLVDLIAYNKIKPAVNQIETHLYCQRAMEHEWEKKYGVAHMAYAPLGQGRANEMFAERLSKSLPESTAKRPRRFFCAARCRAALPSFRNRLIRNGWRRTCIFLILN